MKDPDDPLNEAYFQSEREYMVEHQIARRGIRDLRVLDAMRSVPRHEFVPPEYQHAAYADGPLPLGSGQTISQPYIVALMSELLELVGNEKVLEVGTGSGYQAALLAELAREVYSIERHARLANSAELSLRRLGYANVHILIGDGSKGLPEFSPYEGIIVTAAAPAAPQKLLDQLTDGGRLVIPVGSRGSQFLECWQRQGESFSCENVLSVAFVPLIGSEGWKE
jgi:protein-L-isoaspartate(D-aspartate) O-methyltransferase